MGSLLLRFLMVTYLVVLCHMMRLDCCVNLVLLLLMVVLWFVVFWLMVIHIMFVGIRWTELPSIHRHTFAKE